MYSNSGNNIGLQSNPSISRNGSSNNLLSLSNASINSNGGGLSTTINSRASPLRMSSNSSLGNYSRQERQERQTNFKVILMKQFIDSRELFNIIIVNIFISNINFIRLFR